MADWINKQAKVLVVFCNFFAALIVLLALVFVLPRWKGSLAPPALAIGSKFHSPFKNLPRDKDILYVAISANCKECERESDSYRNLEQSPDVMQNAHILYLMPQNEEAGRAFLNQLGLRSVAHFSTLFPGTGIERFPTILLVDRNSIVQFSHVGALSGKDRQSLATALVSCPVGIGNGGDTLCGGGF